MIRAFRVLNEVAVRPDKQKVVDEVWDDARVESFLRAAHRHAKPFRRILAEAGG